MDAKFRFESDEITPYLKKQLASLKGGVPPEGLDAAKKVAFDWWRKAGTGETGAPLDSGTLRGSLSAGAQGNVVQSGSPDNSGGGGSPNRDFQSPRKNEILIEVGANTEYAAAVHENVSPGGNKQARITGRGKYIEFNLRENMKKWLNFIGKAFGSSLKR